jgi:hypothetical protein
VNIESRAPNYTQPTIENYCSQFSLIGTTIILCNITLSNQKKWLIYSVNEQTGQDLSQFVYNDQSTSTSTLIVQPNTLPYGIYRIVYTVRKDCLYNEIDTFIKIQPSGLMLSTLSQRQGMYGGLIEITRGSSQEIKFNPFLNTIDLDSVAVITSLTFKYMCQVIDSNIERGYPINPSTNQVINLDEFKYNTAINQSLLECFNSTGLNILFECLNYKF